MTPDSLTKSGTEDGHQAALFNWANMAAKHGFLAARDDECYKGGVRYILRNYGKYTGHAKSLEMLHSTPNGGKRDKITAARMKSTGLKAGYPDISLDVARGGFHGLRIELKRPATATKSMGRTSTPQNRWIDLLLAEGYYAVICVGWLEAVQHIENYLKLETTPKGE